MEPLLIAGLGNPGDEYALTRHNAGLEFINLLCDNYSLTLKKENQIKTRGIEVGHIFYFGDKYSKPLMHHKFLIGLSAAREPIWVMNGSFNVTESAVTNLENIMIFDDPEIASTFFDEFKRLHRISKPLKIRA